MRGKVPNRILTWKSSRQTHFLPVLVDTVTSWESWIGSKMPKFQSLAFATANTGCCVQQNGWLGEIWTIPLVYNGRLPWVNFGQFLGEILTILVVYNEPCNCGVALLGADIPAQCSLRPLRLDRSPAALKGNCQKMQGEEEGEAL